MKAVVRVSVLCAFALFVLLAACVVWLPSSDVIPALADSWIRSDSLPPNPLDAAVVLSSGFKNNSTLSPTSTDRLLTGVGLWKAGRVRRIVTTREERSVGDVVVSSDEGQRRVLSEFNATANWLIVAGANSTRSEASRSAEMLQSSGIKTIAVVTSPLHTRRACAAFERVGFRVYCVSTTVETPHARPASSLRDVHLQRLRVYLYELAATLKYRLSGWV